LAEPIDGDDVSNAIDIAAYRLCIIALRSGSALAVPAAPQNTRSKIAKSNDSPEVLRMKSTIWTVAALSLIALLVTVAPDIKRYMRIRSM
jgi:hypothetical protein